jgi:hypothetical protein
VVSEDWVVRYKNRLLQLERQSQHWAPAKSRVLVRENETGEVAIHYRGQRLGFRELPPASTAPPSPNRAARFQQLSIILGDKATETWALPASLQHGETTTRGHQGRRI